MRKLIVGAFVSLDGVMQAPGGPEEDRSGGFAYGGWTFPFFDEAAGAEMDKLFASPFDLLLGRKTYDIFAGYWPHAPADDAIGVLFNKINKYVATRNSGLVLDWNNSVALGSDAVAAVRELKRSEGPDLMTQGSADFLQTLFASDLVDELNLLIFPVILGEGKRLFAGTALPAAFRLVESTVTGSGVTINRYARDGAVKTGSFAAE